MVDILNTAILPALLELFQFQHLTFLALGVLLGLSVGILPGLGGLAGMALVLPFVYGMDQTSALAMMIGLTSVTTTSDTFPSVLMGIPGSASSQATVLDGYPLSKSGQAARALSAAFSASMIGGVIGAIFLTFAIFAARPILLMIGFGEQLLLVVLALVLVGMLTGPSPVKGLASCGLGLLFGTVGAATATAELRMTFGTIYLSDGLPLVLIALGIFALPEIIEVLRFRERISENKRLGQGWRAGLRDTWIHRWIVLRCASLGAIMGALPGIGGSVIDWLAYGHILQTSKDTSRFGKGDIRGVIAPESANNAKEGGALIPTLLFGIPGSGTMALLLAAFVLIGIQPGRQMVENDISLTFVIIWSIALANIVGAGIAFAMATPIAKLTTVKYTYIAPFIIVMIYFAAFQATAAWGDLIGLTIIGIVATFMKRFGWSRPAFLIGFVLSGGLEAAFYRTAQIYGFDFLARPTALILVALVLVTGYFAMRTRTRVSDQVGEMRSGRANRAPQIIFAGCVILVPIFFVFDVFDLKFLGSAFPIIVASITALLVGISVLRLATAPEGSAIIYDAATLSEPGDIRRSLAFCLLLLIGLLAASALIGFLLAAPLFVLVFLRRIGETRLRWSIVGGVATFAFLLALGRLLNMEYAQGLLQIIFGIDWPLAAIT